MLKFKNLDAIPEMFPWYGIGLGGPKSFIGTCAHVPNMLASLMFQLDGASPSRDELKAKWFRKNNRLPEAAVSTNFVDHLPGYIERHQGNLLVDITSDTALHASHLTQAMDLGATELLCEKPLVRSLSEFREVRAKAQAKKATIYEVFNHRYNPGVFAIRNRIAGHGLKRIKRIQLWFRQAWLQNDDPKSQQSDSRLGDKLCTLLDLYSHIGDLARFVLGVDGIGVRDCSLKTTGFHGRDAYDTIEGIQLFPDGVEVELFASQAFEGKCDDIGILVTFEDGTHWMWALERGADCLWTSTGDGRFNDWNEWKQHFPGASPVFNGVPPFWKNPPGHLHGWDFMWVVMLRSIAADMLLRKGYQYKADLPPDFTLPVPTMEVDGLQSTLLIEAHQKSAEDRGALVTFASVDKAA